MKDEALDPKELATLKAAVDLLATGQLTAQRINDVLSEADDLRATRVELMIIGAIMYAAGYAHADDLDLDDFLALCASAYNNVELVKQKHSRLLKPWGH